MKISVAKWLLAAAFSVGYGGLASGLVGQDADKPEDRQTAPDVQGVIDQIETNLDNANLPEQQKKQILDSIRESLKHVGDGQPIVFEYKFDDADQQGGVVTGRAKVQIRTWSSDQDDDEGEESNEEKLELKVVAPDGKALELENQKQMRDMLERARKLQRRMQLKRGAQDDADDIVDYLQAMDPLGEGRFMLGIALQQRAVDSDAEGGGDEDAGDEDSGDEGAEVAVGVVVERVFEESPAAEAGLQSGDVIVQVDGTDVTNPEPLQDAVQAAGKAGKALKLTFRRDGEEQTAKIQPKKNFTRIRRLPQELRERIAQIRSGADRIIVLDEDVDIADPLDDDDDALNDLRSDVESLKDDVREIKAMLKKLSERD